VSVLVPVYNTASYLRPAIESVLAQSYPHFELILIDDGSSDGSAAIALEYANRDARIRLLRNERNLGFVASVNRGAAHAHGHFVILNTDTVVPPNWLERLLAPMVADAGIASTTPFSNAATICSFPHFAVDGALIEGVTVEETDRAFQSLAIPADLPLAAPTGVGFCMGINGRIWREIGNFDEVLFAEGYGEENDWCQRAIAAGFRNVLVPNLFVYHLHGGSFGSAQKALLQQRNARVLAHRWPSYDASVAAFITGDPWATLRLGAILRLCLAAERRPLVILDHVLGGGANSYRQRQVQDALAEGRAVLLLTWEGDRPGIDAHAMLGDLDHKTHLGSWEAVLAHKHLFGACEFVYNNMVSWGQPLEILDGLVEIATGTGAPLIVLFHDFYPVCPSYALVGHDGRFCGVPDNLRACDACLPQNGNAMPRHDDIRTWRSHWQRVLDAAREVRFFSRSSAAIAQRVFAIDASKLRIEPHAPLTDFGGRRIRLPQADELVIGVVGLLNRAKGAGIVNDIARLLMVERPNARIVLIGDMDPAYRRASPANVLVHGGYERECLPDLLEAYGVGVCVLPSIIPETFSYVVQELTQLEMPLVCFAVGAPAERIGSYRLGKVARDISAEAMLTAVFALEREARTPAPPRRETTAA
jgi:GT2 family glycosyltransferase